MASVIDVVRKHMGDPEMSNADIVEVVKAELPNARTTTANIGNMLALLRKKHGVEAVPYRPRTFGAKGYGLEAWLKEKMTDGVERSNRGLAVLASKHFNQEVSRETVASTRAKFKRQGVPGLSPAAVRMTAEEDFADE